MARLKREGASVFDRGGGGGSGGGSAEGAGASEVQGWTIVLTTLAADRPVWESRGELMKVRQLEGLGGARLITRNGAEAIVLGDYPDARDARAQAELKRVRGMVVGGQRPFARALLVPPTGAGAETEGMEGWDLRRVRSDPANEGKEYTLQIGMWDSGGGATDAAAQKQSREAAEAQVKELREQGVEAYFYHGPLRSTVAVGLFTPEQVLGGLGEAPEVVELKRRFPHNLMNGRLQVQKAPGPDGKTVERRLVSIVVKVP